jgi:membrane-bound serine protease (ClpP class)
MIEFLAEVGTQPDGWGASPLVAAALLLLGFAFIVAEIFTVTFGFFTLCAIASFVSGLYVAWSAGTPWFIGASVVVVAGVPVFIAMMLKVMPHTRWGRRLIPDAPKTEDVTASGADASLLALAGKQGRAMGMLRPSGIAMIDGRRYDVVAEGLPINADRPIKVVLVEGNRVVVREIE